MDSNDRDADPDSRVTTPSSPGSTSGESLSALDESDAAIHNVSMDDAVSQHQPPGAAPSTSASTSSVSFQRGTNGSQQHASTSTLNAAAGPSASTRGNNSSTTISGRRRHHHHQHSLTLGTGSAKMGSSITDSAQSTEDEMYDDEDKEEVDTEDDRPRVLYPALATPKAAGNNFWPFGTVGEDGQLEEVDGDGERHMLPEAVVGPSSSSTSTSTTNSASSLNEDNQQPSSSSHHQQSTHPPTMTPSHRKQSLTSSETGTGNAATTTSMAVYRSQVHAPSGANAAFLPHEILLKILRNVRSTEDLVSSLQVCKSWCQCGVELLWNKPLFPHVGPLIKMLVILSRYQTTTFNYSNFIKRLNFSQLADKMSDALLIRLYVCNRLERLTLAGCLEITDNSLISLLGNCKNLVALDLSDCGKITDQTVIMAAKTCKRLQGLNLSGCKLVTDDGVMAIAKGCPLLRRVKLRNLESLTDDAVISLVLSCPLLLEVDLYGCTGMTDRTLWALFRNSSHLRELSLSNCNQITGDGFPQKNGKAIYIKGADDPALQGLKPLNQKLVNFLSSSKSQDSTTTTTRSSSTPQSMANLSSLLLPPNTTILSPKIFDHVRYLDLTGMINLNDIAMAGIVATMPNVRNVVLAKCSNLTDESVFSICRLGKHIHFLHLGHVSNITDKAVSTLARACTRLRYIDLACCPNLTDLSVFELAANLPRLKRIGLVRVSNLTDQAIFALAERTTLERIHLSYCEHVSVSAVQFLLSRLNRLNHLSLTGVPAFRRADLQHFCRPPPKDFNPHQRSTFCVYSGKGVHELRKHLMALQQAELHHGAYNGGLAGNHSSLLPQPHHLLHHHNHQLQQHPNANHQLQFHHQQFAQLQLGNGPHQQQHNHNQQLPTYPHLFQHPAGHAVISQVPLQMQGMDDGEDVDEDVDEEDDDNGDDEADEDRAVPEGLSSAGRRQHTSHSHTHRHGSSRTQHQQHEASNGSPSRTTYGSTFAPPPYYRGNHRMTARVGELLDEASESPSSGETVTIEQAAPSSAALAQFSNAFYSTGVAPAHSTTAQQQYFRSQRGFSTAQDTAWLDQITGNEPTTQITVPPITSQSTGARETASAPTGHLASSRPFTPARGPRSPNPATASVTTTPGTSASNSVQNNEMDLIDMQEDLSDTRQRSHSVDMDLNTTEDDPQTATLQSPPEDGASRTMRPRRDTIMQSNYRQDS